MPKEPRPLHDLHPLRLLPLVLCLAMVVFCIIRGGFSVEDILSYAPRNVWLAAGFLLLLYLAKCLSVAFPIIVLQVAAGHLFAPAAALALNILGLAVDLTVPFWIGRFSGSGLTARLLARPWHHRRGLRPFSSGLSPLAKAPKEQNLTPHPTESLFAGGDLFPPHV